MRLFELNLDEEAVLSSWIEDLAIDKDGDVLMSLHSGRSYVIQNLGKDTYQTWISAGSKGKFWHSNIKNNYQVRRVK